MKKIWMHQIGDSGQDYMRACLPALHCRGSLKNEGIDLSISKSYRTDQDCDVLILHRVVQKSFLPLVRHLVRKGKRLIIECDDDLHNIPWWNPAFPQLRKENLDIYEETLQLAHLVCVSTEELKQATPCDKSKIRVCPNLVDLDAFPEYSPISSKRILWAGSFHHEGDFADIIPAVEALDCEVLFMGDMPSQLRDYKPIKGTNLAVMEVKRQYADRVKAIDSVVLEDFYERVILLDACIGIAPLADIPFNLAKSSLKFMEYSCLNMCCVATDMPCYANCYNRVKPGDTGGWYEVLNFLLNNNELRQQQVLAARKLVEEHHSWQSDGKNSWLEFFRESIK